VQGNLQGAEKPQGYKARKNIGSRGQNYKREEKTIEERWKQSKSASSKALPMRQGLKHKNYKLDYLKGKYKLTETTSSQKLNSLL
jgi:hypothetical protein